MPRSWRLLFVLLWLWLGASILDAGIRLAMLVREGA